MLPVAVRFGGSVVVHAFGVWLCLGALLAWHVAKLRARSLGLPLPGLAGSFVVCAVGALVGARLLFEAHTGDQRWWSALLLLHKGGLDLWGALLGGALALIVLCRVTGQGVWAWCTVLTPATLTAVALGRVGSFFSGCDYGRLLSAQAPDLLRALGTYKRWSPAVMELSAGPPVWLAQVERQGLLASSPASLATHPVQLYEAVAIVSWLLIARATPRLVTAESSRMRLLDSPLQLILGYTAIAFAFEWLRGDVDRGLIGPVLRGPTVPLLGAFTLAMLLHVTSGQLGYHAPLRHKISAMFCLVYGALLWPVGFLMHESNDLSRLSLAQCGALASAALCALVAGPWHRYQLASESSQRDGS